MRWLVTGAPDFSASTSFATYSRAVTRSCRSIASRSTIPSAIGSARSAAALPLYAPDEIHSIDVDGTRTVIAAAGARAIRNYRWYLAHADTLGKAGVTHRVPWKQGALALAKLAFRTHA